MFTFSVVTRMLSVNISPGATPPVVPLPVLLIVTWATLSAEVTTWRLGSDWAPAGPVKMTLPPGWPGIVIGPMTRKALVGLFTVMDGPLFAVSVPSPLSVPALM